VGLVRSYEIGDSSWCDLMGGTVDGETVPPDPAPALLRVGVITEGTTNGFDFGTGMMVAQPADQDVQYISSGPSDAVIQSFASGGISWYIGEGIYDFPAYRRYSTFLPPDYDIWGSLWGSPLGVLSDTYDYTGGTMVVKTREGSYALVHITDATTGALSIEYVYPYGWFAWD
jgi:hypothetical protein